LPSSQKAAKLLPNIAAPNATTNFRVLAVMLSSIYARMLALLETISMTRTP